MTINYQTLNDKIRFVIPIMLDRVPIRLNSWCGYNVSAQNRNVKSQVQFTARRSQNVT